MRFRSSGFAPELRSRSVAAPLVPATCRICGVTRAQREYEVREMLIGLRDVHRYFQCAACGCLQIGAMPADLARYYGEGYYSYQPMAARSALERLMMRYRNEYAAFGRGVVGRLLCRRYPTQEFAFLQPIREHVSEESRIVDVGCGSGILLNIFREAGFRKLVGVDPFIATDIRYPNGVTIRKMFVEELGGTWDLVMYHHSFEHLWDQLATLKKTLALLRPGGHCVIALPTASSYAWQHYGVDWVQLDAPRHFYLHTIGSLERLARDAGFDVLTSVYDSKAFQFWGSEQYRQDIPLSDPRSYSVDPATPIFPPGQIKAYERQAKELNAARQGDQVMFYLRRPA